MTLFPSLTLAVACAALIWALSAFDRLINVGPRSWTTGESASEGS